MGNGSENWVWLAFTHCKEVEKLVTTAVAVEGDIEGM